MDVKRIGVQPQKQRVNFGSYIVSKEQNRTIVDTTAKNEFFGQNFDVKRIVENGDYVVNDNQQKMLLSKLNALGQGKTVIFIPEERIAFVEKMKEVNQVLKKHPFPSIGIKIEVINPLRDKSGAFEFLNNIIDNAKSVTSKELRRIF